MQSKCVWKGNGIAALVAAVLSLAGAGRAQEAAKPQWESVADNIFQAKGVGGGRCVFGVDRASGQVFVNCGAAVAMPGSGSIWKFQR